MYVHIAIFSFATQTQLPSCLIPLLLFASLMMISKREGGDLEKVRRDHPRMHPRICSGERRAPILVSLRESSWASPPRGPSLIGCHKPKWRYLLQTELPPPEMPCPNSIAYRRHYYYLMIQSAPLPHTHTQTQLPANIQTITLLK